MDLTIFSHTSLCPRCIRKLEMHKKRRRNEVRYGRIEQLGCREQKELL